MKKILSALVFGICILSINFFEGIFTVIDWRLF